MTMKNESIRLQSTATGSYLQKKGVITFSSKSMLFDDTATKLAETVALFSKFANIWFRARCFLPVLNLLLSVYTVYLVFITVSLVKFSILITTQLLLLISLGNHNRISVTLKKAPSPKLFHIDKSGAKCEK